MQLVVGGTVVKNTPAIAKDTGDRSSIPGPVPLDVMVVVAQSLSHV